MDSHSYLLFRFLPLLPSLLVEIAGLIIAIIFWQRNPKAALVTIIGCVILILESLIFSSINILLPGALNNNGMTASQITNYFYLISFVRSIVSAMGLGCLITAIFCWRK